MTETNGNQDNHVPRAWWAIYTRHQHEKTIAAILSGNSFEAFLPLYTSLRQWKDRTKELSLPLFPCYVFLRCDLERRVRVLSTPGVHSIFMLAGQPAIIPDNEIEAIRRAVDSPLKVEPHPFLRRGDWVRVKSGPLVNIEGILIRRKNSYRLILSAEILQKSLAVEVDAFSVEPLAHRPEAPRFSAGSRLEENPRWS